jgi:ubiquinol-cytochrome c reductase cytochrome b subunit
LIHTAPKPDFYFLPIYAILALLPAYMETFLLLVAPVFGIAILILLPFYSGTGEKSYRRRPVAVVVVLLAFLTAGILAYLGTFAPWSPHMEAWSGAATPITYLKGRSPLELQGAILIQSKQCRNCHSLGGEGGLRGPELDTVATRLTRDQLIRQVIQGSGNMPAYGKNLRPAEVTALVSFMQTLRPSFQPAARDSTQ